MTKQEKIKEVYGDFFEKCNPDEDGWTNYRTWFNHVGHKIDYDFSGALVTTVRPKKLSGIENNNGWIRLDNESDLPKSDQRCEFIDYMKRQFYGRFENRMGGLFIDESRRFEHPEYRTESVTHWKPINTSTGPIY